MREIKISEVGAFRIGQAENAAAGTGCTVVICENGMAAGLDVSKAILRAVSSAESAYGFPAAKDLQFLKM